MCRLTALDWFGSSLAFSADGTALAIGVRGDSSRKGAVRLFEKSGGSWSQSLKIFDKPAADGAAGAGELDVSLTGNTWFGSGTALSADGTLLAVGASGNNSRKGAVYLFEKRGGSWSQSLKIFDKPAADGAAGAGELDVSLTGNDNFGSSVALSPDGLSLAVGATGDSGNKGSAHLFEKSAGVWAKTLKISDSTAAGNHHIPLETSSYFGSVAFAGNGSLLAVGANGVDSASGAVYLYEITPVARSVSVSALAGRQSTVWHYVTTTGSVCGAAQFTASPTAYTEGSRIVFISESDNGKRVCFRTTTSVGNSYYTLTDTIRTIDRTAPVLTATRIGIGSGVNYRVDASDATAARYGLRGRTKDNVALSQCTPATNAAVAGWTDYIPGEPTGAAHDTNGRCVIVTDAAGNAAAQHLSDGDTSIPTSVSDIGLHTDSDTGTVGDDTTADKTEPVIVFTQNAAATITARYRKSGGEWNTVQSGRITATATAGRITLPNLTDGDGAYETEITQTIASVAANTIYTFTLDTAAPEAFIAESMFRPKRSSLKFSNTGDVAVPLSARDYFGRSASFSHDGSVLVISATGDTGARGAVYIFENTAGTWRRTLKIFDKPDADGPVGAGELDIPLSQYALFGRSSALSADGTLLVVGSQGYSGYRGAVYLFEKSGNSWEQVLKIFNKPRSEGAPGPGELTVETGRYSFGTATALSADGTVLAVGARVADRSKGAMYLFEKSDGVWSQSYKISDNNGNAGELAVPLFEDDYFGTSAALSADGTVLAVGANGDDDGEFASGAVYLFEKSNGVWSQVLKISNNSGGPGHLPITLDNDIWFGSSVAVSAAGDQLAVGAYGDSDDRGAVYLFEKNSGVWSRTFKISDNNGGTGNLDIPLETSRGQDSGDSFGLASGFSRNGTLLAVGATGDNEGGIESGALYLFTDTGYGRQVSVTARDNERGSVWRYVTTTGSSCAAAQFVSSSVAYTEGDPVTFSAESDNGTRICFRITDAAGNVSYTLTAPMKTIDRTAPTLNTTRVGTGTTANYRVRATDVSPTTGRTKDGVGAGSCAADTDTSGTGWTDYTPGALTGTAHDTDGRCVIITDAAGNNTERHLSDAATIDDSYSLAAVAGDTQVTLLWSDAGDAGITGYEYRQKIGSGTYGAWTAVPSSSATTTHHTVTGLVNGTIHLFMVRSKRGSVGDTPSPEVTATPTADNTAPVLGTVTATSADGTLFGGVRYVRTGDTVTVTVPVTDPNPPSTAPTVTVKFGASGTEHTLTADGTHTLTRNRNQGASSIIATYQYTHTLTGTDIGTLRHKVTGVSDGAPTPNTLTAPTSFTEIAAVKGVNSVGVTGIGLERGSDSGIIGDDITNDTYEPVVVFTRTAGATVTARYRKTDGVWTTIPSGSIRIGADGTAGTVTLPNLTAGDGTYMVEITQRETGQPPHAASYSFTLDTADPAPPTAVTRTAPAAASGTASTITVSVTANDGDRIRLYADAICSVRSGANEGTVPTAGGVTGTVSVVSGPFSSGANTVYAGVVDAAGNIGCSSSSAAYTRNSAAMSVSPTAITEANLDGATVTLTLSGNTFVAGTPTVSHFTVAPSGITGLTVASAVRTSNTVVTLTLGYAGADFDTAGAFTVTVAADAHSGADPYTSDPITANPNILDIPDPLRDVTATPRNAQTTLSWTTAPAGEQVTGYEYRRLVPRAFTPATTEWKHSIYNYSSFRVPSLVPRTEAQNIYYTMKVNNRVRGFDGQKRIYACAWVSAAQRNPDGECATATITSTASNHAEHTFRFTPTQAMINNGGLVMLMTHDNNARHTKWVPFSTQLAYGDWTAIPPAAITTVGVTNTYTVTGLTNNISYAFQVRAVNATGDGRPSAEVTAVPTRIVSAEPAAVTLAADTDSIDPYTTSGTHRTRDTSPTVSFTAVSGATTTAEWKGVGQSTFTATGITVTGSTTARTVTFSNALTDGTYQVKITQDEDGAGAMTPTAVTYTFIVDDTAPTATAAVTYTGETTANGVTYLNTGDTVTVTVTFDEDMTGTVAGVFKNDATDIPTTGGSHHTIAAARTNATVQTLRLTVREAGPAVSSGDLKYHITNGATLTDLAGNVLGARSITAIASTVIDTAAPSLTETEVGSGRTANYRVTATDSSPVTGRTKDNVAAASCTAGTDTSGAGWTDYTPGDLTGTADDTNGRCVIIADAAGNAATVHLLDGIPTPTVRAVAGDRKVTLLWDDPSDSGISSYEYQRKTGSGSYGAWTEVPGSSATTTHYTAVGLTNGTVYAFKVRTKTGSRTGAPSAEVTATPVTDTTPPTLGTVTVTSTDGTVTDGVRYLSTGDTVTVSVPVIDPNPPTGTLPVTLKFGVEGTERTLSTVTRTLAYQSPGIVTTYAYTYTITADDNGTAHHKVGDIRDSAAIRNVLPGHLTFTETVSVEAFNNKVFNSNLQDASDSGIADDHITNDATAPVVEFTIFSGATITARYRKTGGSWTPIPSGSITTASRAGTVTLPNLTAGDGDYEVEITQRTAGHTDGTAVYTFTLDTTAPTAPTDISTPSSFGTGATVVMTVTAAAGDRVRLYSDSSCNTRMGTVEGTVPQGQTTVEITTPMLTVAAHTIYGGVVDDAGNVGCYATGAALHPHRHRRIGDPRGGHTVITFREDTLNGATVDVTVTGTQYESDAALESTYFTTTGITGLSVSRYSRRSNTVVRLTLAFDDTDFDISDSFAVTVNDSAHTATGDITSNVIPVTAVNDTEKPTGLALTTDSGKSATDKLTNDTGGFTFTVPSDRWTGITTNSTAAVFRYDTAGGICATPTGLNTGWETHATESDHGGFDSTTGLWTVDGGTNPDDGTHCYTAVYDLDGVTAVYANSHYSDAIKVETDDTDPTAPTALSRNGGSGIRSTITVRITADNGLIARLYSDNLCDTRHGTNEAIVTGGTADVETGTLTGGSNSIYAGVVDDAGNVGCRTTAVSYTRTPVGTLTAVTPSSLSEDTLNGAIAEVTISIGSFNATLTPANFTTTLAGLTVSAATRQSNDAVARLTLAYTGADFDGDTDFSVGIAASEHSGSDALTTGTLTVTAVNDPPKATGLALETDSGSSSQPTASPTTRSGFTFTVPAAQQGSVASGSTATCTDTTPMRAIPVTRRVRPTTDGLPTQQKSDNTGYDSGTGVWTVDGGTNPDDGEHCYTAVYDLDGATATYAQPL